MSTQHGTAETIVQNSMLTAVARVSMALFLPTIGLIGWLYAGSLDSRFNVQADRIFRLEDRIDKLADTTNKLLSTVGEMTVIASRTRELRESQFAKLDAIMVKLTERYDLQESRLDEIEKLGAERAQIIKNILETISELKVQRRTDLSSGSNRAFNLEDAPNTTAANNNWPNWPKNLVPR